ncbi:GNAT family N-acetyltransferase [candidate division WS5 bacterium]|uniref:GNAT family N-acetyltransferase n=1 Tax=candidate division WS5 bacterium TaxID=2093353 RepID=A0A419DEM8_9BACT|nr:MAG: GNAT family N-acetyltransferase [candidate division WS5 bacterium]
MFSRTVLVKQRCYNSVMKIRKAKPNEWDKIQELNHKLFLYEDENLGHVWNTDWPFEKESLDYYKKLPSSKEHLAVVCEEEGKVVGYLVGLLEKDASIYKNTKRVASLEHMFVEKEYRQRGIGRKLFEFFKEWAKENRAEKIKVGVLYNNEKTIRFYKELGFEDFSLMLMMDS